MPSIPRLGSVTLCEINREFVTADSLSDDGAKNTYGKILGTVFPPIPFHADDNALISDRGGADLAGGVRSKGLLSAPWSTLTNSLKGLFHPNYVDLMPEVDLQLVCWHHNKHILAFVSGKHHVTVHNYEDPAERDFCILSDEIQRGVTLLEWRPSGGRTLSVACKDGICIWSVCYPGNIPSIRSGISAPSAIVGSEVRWILVDFLRSSNHEHISAMSWSPNGRYLATGSYESSSFTIWDVARGVGTPLRRGLGGVSILKWSPNGDYFLTSKFDGIFYLWETDTWTSESWSSSGGFVKGVSWDPDGCMVLVTFSGSSTLGAIHFAAKPPSLSAHLLPVDLPEIASLSGSDGIEKVAWDTSGERLAVSYKGGDELYRGLVAVYDVRRMPLLSLSFVGFVRGPGENPKALAFAFHNKFKHGPLLTVCWSSGLCCTYPLILRSHIRT